MAMRNTKKGAGMTVHADALAKVRWGMIKNDIDISIKDAYKHIDDEYIVNHCETIGL